MTISDVCIKRPVFTWVLVALPVVLGLVAYGNLGVDLFPNVDFQWFPWDSPAIISVPVGFFLGWLGSVVKPDGDAFADQGAEMEVRSMTGAGAAGALDH